MQQSCPAGPRDAYSKLTMLVASRSGVIDSDQRLTERRSHRASTGPIEAEPYVEILLDATDSGFTPEEEAFFAEGDEIGRDDDELLD